MCTPQVYISLGVTVEESKRQRSYTLDELHEMRKRGELHPTSSDAEERQHKKTGRT
jgi:hypothetical protein